MAVQLREPGFLRGRTSVVQRATLISLVLGALSAVAGWTMTLLELAYNDLSWSASPYLVLPATWSIAFAVFLCVPLNAWNGRTQFWTLLAMPANAVWFYLWIVSWQDGPEAYGVFLQAWPGYAAVAAACSLVQLRPGRIYLLAYVVCIAASIIPVLAFLSPLLLEQNGTRGFWVRLRVFETGFHVVRFGSWYAALAIPWGIPFWWPPEPSSSSGAGE